MRHGLRVSSPRVVALYTRTDSHTTISVLKSAICGSGESNLCRVEKVCELHNSGFVCMCDDKAVHTQVAWPQKYTINFMELMLLFMVA